MLFYNQRSLNYSKSLTQKTIGQSDNLTHQKTQSDLYIGDGNNFVDPKVKKN